MAFEKLFNEIYSVVILKYFWDGYKDGFVKSESPDWINREMKFGMEVSQALFPSDGQAEHFLENYLGSLKESIPDDLLEKYAGMLYFYNGRLWALLNGGPINMSYQEKVIFRFTRKLEKLNTNYEDFYKNALFLYAHTKNQTTDEVWEIMRKMKEIQNSKPRQFSLVFIDFKRSLYILDFEQDSVREISIPEEARVFMKEVTEKLRQGQNWNNGEIIEF